MNKGPSSETASNHSSNSHDSAVDFFTKFNIHGGWKSLLLYQFELQFSFLIMLSVVISYSAVLLDAAFALGVYRVRWIEKTYDRFSIRKYVSSSSRCKLNLYFFQIFCMVSIWLILLI